MPCCARVLYQLSTAGRLQVSRDCHQLANGRLPLYRCCAALQVLTALTKQSRQLALAALSAGAARTIYAALVKWAAVMPAPDTLPGTEPQTPDSDTQLNELDLDPGVRHEHRRSSSSGRFGKVAGVRASSPFEQGGTSVVDPAVAGAAAAALQVLHTLLQQAADQPGSSRNSRASAGSSTAAAAAARPDFHMPEDLPALLLELWLIPSLQQQAAGCLAQLQELGLLAAHVGGHGNKQHLQESAAAAATQQPGVDLNSVAAAGAAVAAGEGGGFGAGQRRSLQQGAADLDGGGVYGVQESSRLMAQLKV
jgi:hypothetical protein